MAEITCGDVLKKAICSITTVLRDKLLEICDEESKKRKGKVWVKDWMDKKKCGASETIIREFKDNDPLEFKSMIRLTPERFKELLLMITDKSNH